MGRAKNALRKEQPHRPITLSPSARRALEELERRDQSGFDLASAFLNAGHPKAQTICLKSIGTEIRRRVADGSSPALVEGLGDFLLRIVIKSLDAPVAVRYSALRATVPALTAGYADQWRKEFTKDLTMFANRSGYTITELQQLAASTNLLFGDGDSRQVFFREDRTVLAAAVLSRRTCDEFYRMLDGRTSLATDLSAEESENTVLFALKLLHDILQHSAPKLRDFNNTRPAEADFTNSPLSQEDTQAPTEGDVMMPLAQEGSMSSLAEELGESADIAMKLLRKQSFPRSCAMAAAVACVATAEFPKPLPGLSYSWSSDDPFQMSTMEGFNKLALCRSLTEGGVAGQTMDDLLFGSPKIFEAICEFCRASDPHMRIVAFETLLIVLRRLSKADRKLEADLQEKMLMLIADRSHDRNSSEALQLLISMTANSDEYWKRVCTNLTKQDWKRNGKIGAKNFLEIAPDSQERAIAAIDANQTLSKIGCDFLANLWKHLKRETEVQEFYDLTAPVLVRALGHPNKSTRERILEMALPEYMKLCGRDAVKQVERAADKISAAQVAAGGHAAGAKTSAPLSGHIEESQLLSAVISALSVAKKVLSADPRDSAEPVDTIMRALTSKDIVVRIMALDYVVSHQVPSRPLEDHVFELVKSAVPPMFMPDGTPAQRSKIRAVFGTLLERLHCSFDGAKNRTAWWDKERKLADKEGRRDSFEYFRDAYMTKISGFFEWLCVALVKHAFPGSSHKRKLASLLILERALETSRDDEIATKPRAMVAEDVLSHVVDGWDRNREAAYKLAKCLSPPYGLGENQIANALQKASELLRSPRLRDADSGALVCRAVFNRILECENLENVSLQDGGKDHRSATSLGGVDGQIRLMTEVLGLMESARKQGQKDLAKACEQGLVHGYARLLRYMLEDINFRDLGSCELKMRTVLGQCILGCEASLHVAMQGVAFREPNVNAHEQQKDKVSDERQKFVTSCFLSVAELCGALSVLIRRASLTDEHVSSSGSGMIDKSQVETVAAIYDHVLRNTRHTGVVDKCSEALRTVSARLLRSPSPSLRSLPSTWLKATLASATNGDLYVLRRSAGLPAYVIAILGAEHSTSHRQLLADTVRRLLATADGRDSGHLDGARATAAISHSMNILRALFTDGVLAESMLPFVGDTLEMTIDKFRAESWLVRNSALMLFSALLRRGVGLGITHPGSRMAGIGVTGREFFARYPLLREKVLEELNRGSRDLMRSETNFSETGASKGSEQGLFPVLCLLASLQPTADGDPDDVRRMAEFLPALNTCARSRDESIRRMAAAASVSVYDTTSSIEKATTILQCLPKLSYPGNPQRWEPFSHFSWPSSTDSQKVEIAGPLVKCATGAEALELAAQVADDKFAHQISLPVPSGRHLVYFVVDGERQVHEELPAIDVDGVKMHPLVVQKERYEADILRALSATEPFRICATLTREIVRSRLRRNHKGVVVQNMNALHGQLLCSLKLMEAQLIASDLDLTSAMRIARAIFVEAGILDRLDFFPDGALRCPSVACVCLDIVAVGLRCLVEVAQRSQGAEELIWAKQAIHSTKMSLIRLTDVLGDTAWADRHGDRINLFGRSHGDGDLPIYTFYRFEVSILARKLKETMQFLPNVSPEDLEDVSTVERWFEFESGEVGEIAVSLLKAVPLTAPMTESGETGDIMGAVMCAITASGDSQQVGRLADLISSHLSANRMIDPVTARALRTFAMQSAVAGHGRHLSKKEPLLKLLGHLVSFELSSAPFSVDSAVMPGVDSDFQKDCVAAFHEAALQSQPTSLRLAACNALQNSKFLEAPEFVSPGVVAHAFLIAAELLQDDDDEVREAALRALASESETLTTLVEVFRRLSRVPTTTFLRHLDEELELWAVVDGEGGGLLAKLYDTEREDLRADGLQLPERMDVSVALFSSEANDGRLFDEEQDNLHAEGALTAQLALMSVYWLQLPPRATKDNALTALSQLRQGMETVLISDRQATFLFGACRRTEVFRILHVLILRAAAIVLLLPPTEARYLDMEQVAAIAELAGKLALQLSLRESLTALLELASGSGDVLSHLRTLCFLLPP